MSKSGLLSVRTSAANAGKKRSKSESKSRSRYDDTIFGHLRVAASEALIRWSENLLFLLFCPVCFATTSALTIDCPRIISEGLVD